MIRQRALFYNICVGNYKVDRNCHISAGDTNPATGKPYAINPASGNWDDNYFATHFGGASPQNAVNKSIEDSFKKLQQEVISKFGEYQAGHPFNVDQVLADKTTQAAEQIDPYYNELLSGYLKGVTNKISRSQEDTKSLLDELNASTSSYTGQSLLKLNQAVKSANEGFAGNGLFSSGARYANEGILTTGTNNAINDYTRTQDYKANQAKLGNERTITDTNLASTQQQRDIARSQYTDTQSLAGQLTKEAGQQYVQGFNQILPPELQAANGFDALKSIGIYS